MDVERIWRCYMLGRLVCGDDCLAQNFVRYRPTGNFRYQIQAKDYNEGVLWGRVCAEKVFRTEKYYSYQKKSGIHNTVIRIGRKDVESLFGDGFIRSRTDCKNFKPTTSLAVIKRVPIEKILEFSEVEMAEFLAGCFDSDGSIRPRKNQMSIALDSQLKTRAHPLAYSQVRLFKALAEKNKVPLISRIDVDSTPEKLDRARRFVRHIKKLHKDTFLKVYESSGGVKIYISFSCNVTNPKNRQAWNFWTKEVAERLIREDKRRKFKEFYISKKAYLRSYPVSEERLESFGKKLGSLIDTNGYVVVKRPKHPQCEVRIKFLSSAEANKAKREIEKHLRCKVNVFRDYKRYLVSFNISYKNYFEIAKFVIPNISAERKAIKAKKYIDNRCSGGRKFRPAIWSMHIGDSRAESAADRETRGSKVCRGLSPQTEIPLPSFPIIKTQQTKKGNRVITWKRQN